MKDVEFRGEWFGFPRSAFHFQWSNHHVRSTSEEGLHPSLYDLSLEWPEADTLPHRNWLIDAPLWGSPTGTFNWSLCPFRGRDSHANQQESSRTTLAVDHGMVRLSISLYQMMLIILLIVQVPTTKETLCPKSDSSGTTRNTTSLSYPVIPCTCTRKMTNPSGLVVSYLTPQSSTGSPRGLPEGGQGTHTAAPERV